MGTLIVDDGVVSRAYDHALVEAGLVVDTPDFEKAREAIASLAGRPTLDVLTAALGDKVLAEEATWAFDDAVLSEVPKLSEVEGVSEMLDSLDASGILLAVTTSFTPEVRKALLVHLGWTERFAMTLAAQGVRRGHPATDLLLAAILELRIDSVSQVAIVGDNAADLVAGNRAGAGLVVGVRTGRATTDSLLDAPHTHLIDSAAEIESVMEAPRTVGQRRASDR